MNYSQRFKRQAREIGLKCIFFLNQFDCLLVKEMLKAAAEERDLDIEVGKRENRTELILVSLFIQWFLKRSCWFGMRQK